MNLWVSVPKKTHELVSFGSEKNPWTCGMWVCDSEECERGVGSGCEPDSKKQQDKIHSLHSFIKMCVKSLENKWFHKRDGTYNARIYLIVGLCLYLWGVLVCWLMKFGLLQRIKRKLIGEEGRCRCYERQRAKTWGNWSLSHTRWSCHTHLDTSVSRT